jgi:hypothetical protein
VLRLQVAHAIILARKRIEGGHATHAPARLPLQQVDAMEASGFAHKPPLAAIFRQSRRLETADRPYRDLRGARHRPLS